MTCEQNDIAAYIPKSRTSNNEARGFFGKQDFIYKPHDDEYECPAGGRLTRRTRAHQGELIVYRYWSSVCQTCPLKSRCTTGKERRVSRWEHEEVLDRVQARLDLHPKAMTVRQATVEHPFGTIKSWMGSNHFSMKTLENVSTEMSLHVLAYNMKRVMNLVGTRKLLEAI